MRGSDADVPHLRRLTPDAISRRVLLQLGRMPAAALAAGRAIAVLGNAATTMPAARLAGLVGRLTWAVCLRCTVCWLPYYVRFR